MSTFMADSGTTYFPFVNGDQHQPQFDQLHSWVSQFFAVKQKMESHSVTVRTEASLESNQNTKFS